MGNLRKQVYRQKSQKRDIIDGRPARLSYKPWEFSLLGLGALFMLWMSVAFALGYPSLPEIVPMHYDFHGEVNGYGSKVSMWGLLATAWVCWLMMVVAGHFPRSWNVPVLLTSANLSILYRGTRLYLYVLSLMLVGVFMPLFMPFLPFAMLHWMLGGMLFVSILYGGFLFKMR